LIVTPLLDGPQLNSRWAARYASVLADDPGSAVLTLSSYGMVQRCRPHGRKFSPIIALWKDPVRGIREIPLEAGAQGVLLTVCGDRATRRSGDRRLPVDNATHYFDVAVHQVRATNANSTNSSTPQAGTPAPRVLETDELTILTGWAEAVAEVLAHAPERFEAVMANARGEVPWRTAFPIGDPSQQLTEAIQFMGREVRAVTPPGSAPTLDAVQTSLRDDRPDQPRLYRLAHRVLRSTLEQLCTRRATEVI
jgi:hypothetical protein